MLKSLELHFLKKLSFFIIICEKKMKIEKGTDAKYY